MPPERHADETLDGLPHGGSVFLERWRPKWDGLPLGSSRKRAL